MLHPIAKATQAMSLALSSNSERHVATCLVSYHQNHLSLPLLLNCIQHWYRERGTALVVSVRLSSLLKTAALGGSWEGSPCGTTSNATKTITSLTLSEFTLSHACMPVNCNALQHHQLPDWWYCITCACRTPPSHFSSGHSIQHTR